MPSISRKFFRYTTMNSLSVSRIHYLFGEFTINLLGFSQFTLNFREITMNSLFFSWIYYILSVRSTNSLSFLRKCNEFTIFINSLFLSRIYYLFCEPTIFLANSLWFQFVFRINTLNSLEILHEFTWCFVNFLWIYYLSLEFTMNLLYFSRINNEFTPFFANSSWFHSLSIADSTRTGDHQSGKEAETWKQISHSRIIRSSWSWV